MAPRPYPFRHRVGQSGPTGLGCESRPGIPLEERLLRGQDRDVEAELERTRLTAETAGPGSLVVDDLRAEDLAKLGWSGTATHVRSVAGYLTRVPAGEVDYLVLRGVDGTPVAKAGIDYAEAPGVGTIIQLATHGQLQRLGLATALIAAAEERIRRRGLTKARMAVEDDNPRARALYERLGYQEVGRQAVSWEAEAADGSLFTYHTVVTEMDKTLTR
jgi:ribosomal protein S18 acetylase RimI-like enzyme